MSNSEGHGKRKVPPLRFAPVGMTDLCNEFPGRDTCGSSCGMSAPASIRALYHYDSSE
jgi:hypothetical protein